MNSWITHRHTMMINRGERHWLVVMTDVNDAQGQITINGTGRTSSTRTLIADATNSLSYTYSHQLPGRKNHIIASNPDCCVFHLISLLISSGNFDSLKFARNLDRVTHILDMKWCWSEYRQSWLLAIQREYGMWEQKVETIFDYYSWASIDTILVQCSQSEWKMGS